MFEINRCIGGGYEDAKNCHFQFRGRAPLWLRNAKSGSDLVHGSHLGHSP